MNKFNEKFTGAFSAIFSCVIKKEICQPLIRLVTYKFYMHIANLDYVSKNCLIYLDTIKSESKYCV